MKLIENYVQLMTEHSDIACIQLTDQAVLDCGGSEYERLNAVILKQRYRVSCQAALWRKQELLEIIREQESAWEFEEIRFTTLRNNGSQISCCRQNMDSSRCIRNYTIHLYWNYSGEMVQ